MQDLFKAGSVTVAYANNLEATPIVARFKGNWLAQPVNEFSIEISA